MRSKSVPPIKKNGTISVSTDASSKMAPILELPDKDKNVYDKGVPTSNY